MDKMTVQELIEELKKFPTDHIVLLYGGGDINGDFAYLEVCEDEKEANDLCGYYVLMGREGD